MLLEDFLHWQPQEVETGEALMVAEHDQPRQCEAESGEQKSQASKEGLVLKGGQS